MERQVLLDKLSEFLMVEQGGLALYQVVAPRTTKRELKQHYERFGKQTAKHREVLARLIVRLGGDPNYVSPTARLAQFKATKLLESALAVDALAPAEIEACDLENVLLAETKDHADWHLLSQLAQKAPNKEVKEALAEAVKEVETEEDEHLEWARKTLGELALQMVLKGPAPSPERWQMAFSGPLPPIEKIHPSPITEGLLPPSQQPAWQDSLVARAMAVS
jgi:rubrerythrin